MCVASTAMVEKLCTLQEATRFTSGRPAGQGAYESDAQPVAGSFVGTLTPWHCFVAGGAPASVVAAVVASGSAPTHAATTALPIASVKEGAQSRRMSSAFYALSIVDAQASCHASFSRRRRNQCGELDHRSMTT
jgi:hypothetical protein